MSLTPEQQAKAAEYVREWTAIGLSTEPADRPAAAEAIRLVYECGGLKPPQTIVWCESPAAMLRVAGAEVLTQDAADALTGALGSRVGTLAGITTVGDSRALGMQRVEAKPAPLADCIYGQHDAGWLAFYAFMRNELGLIVQTEKLRGLTALAKVCGWCMPYENVCYASERHNILKRDPQGRLHAVDGPALAYPDGWAIYAVRGTHVPAEWVLNKDSLDPRLALTEPNLERRAAVATLLGWHKIMGMLKPRVIDDRTVSVEKLLEMVKDGHNDDGRLLEVELPDEGTARFLEVICPAHAEEKRYLRVPREMRTAREASRWTYGVDPSVDIEARS